MYNFNVSKDGDKTTSFFSIDWSGKYLKVSEGFNRIVIGKRGPYVEFTDEQIILPSFYIPKNQLYRFYDKRVYYIEFRSINSKSVKLYYQLKTVSYANYKVGMFYISPHELFLKTGKCIIEDDNIQYEENEFFG